MFTSTTLRSVMSVAFIALVIVCTMQSTDACETTKAACPVKSASPLGKLVNGLKHLFSREDKSPNREPSVDDGFIPDADTSELPISG